jgi:hypothetical protein
MKTNLQTKLATIAPSICIGTLWSIDDDAASEWRDLSQPGNCFDGEKSEDWKCWQSEVRATAVNCGEAITGNAYLGGTWEKAGDNPAISNPDISGYEKDLTIEALQSLDCEALAGEIADALEWIAAN